MPIVQRFYKQIMPDGDEGASERSVLSSYFENQVIVILGDPGIGKTTEFENAGLSEQGSVFCTVSQFLADPIEDFDGKIIYLDALDEHRAELPTGVSVMDAIRGRLKKLGCPKVRISCRGEEWHHGADVKSLSSVASGEAVYILKMQPLSESDVRSIASEEIEDVDAFLAGARERQLDELLGNPETLNLYLKVYQKDGAWPETRADLMDQSTKLLISEENEQHERVRGEAISDERLMQSAEDLAAIILLGDSGGIALSKAASSPNHVALAEFSDIDLNATKVSARRRLFLSDGPERVKSQHKTIGDYLTAKALVRRIKEKSLPLGRALSLLVGKDDVPLSHLRDVFAWLIALLPEHSVRLIKSDPFGAMIYGDVGQWSIATRRSALKLLSDYAVKDDPWFRAGSWDAPLLGGLVDPELVDDFRNVLQGESSQHVVSVVLDALEHGAVLPDIASDLIQFIRRQGELDHSWLKDRALRIFVRVSPSPIEDCKALLKDICNGSIKDGQDFLRAELLTILYPSEILPSEVVHYFVNRKESGTGAMGRFLRRDLLDRTPKEALQSLADAVLAHPERIANLGRYDERKLRGALVRQLLEAFGETAAVEQIYDWLGMCLSSDYNISLDNDDEVFLHSYFGEHSDLYNELFLFWINRPLPSEDEDSRYHFVKFQFRTLHFPIPHDFPERVLALAAESAVASQSTFLFRVAADLILNRDPGSFSVDLSGLCDYIEKNSQFDVVWEECRVCSIPEWQLKHATSTQEYRRERDERVSNDVSILMSRLTELSSGRDVSNLQFGAEVWFNIDPDSNEKENPVERLRSRTNDVIASAIIEGFGALLRTEKPRTPRVLAKLDCENMRAMESFAILAGADILASRSMENFLALPPANLEAALAYHLIVQIGDQDRTWHHEIMITHPGLARRVLAEIWRTEIACGKVQHLTGAYINNVVDVSAPLILCEAVSLLKESPALPAQILGNLLTAVLCHGDPEDLRPLVAPALADNKVRNEMRTKWLSVAALLWPIEFEKKLTKRVRSGESDLLAAYEILTSVAGSRMNGLHSDLELTMTITVLGKYFNNEQSRKSSGWGDRQRDEDVARTIRGLIDSLADLPTTEAAEAFVAMLSNASLHDWHEYLRHGQSAQAKILRDAQFEPPSAQAVSALLSARMPASMEDFRALAMDILDDCRAFIRGDNSDPWKSFWILAKGGKVDSPKIENDCRNVLLPWIGQYLHSRSVTIEPEAAAVDLGRVDIRLSAVAVGTLPVEVKRDGHKDLWTAMADQLLVRYSNDPKTEGHAIYLVIWFGKDGNGCKPPPKELGISKPETADELQVALEAIKPNKRFSVCVIDVSKPHG